MEKVLYILTGCTAAGKTAIALELAVRHRMEVVSCDSMLFYRGMDIGTAKPSPTEMERVPHHLIDLVPVDETFSVGRYVPLAQQAVDQILSRGKRPLVVGGSGFYLKSFLEPVVDELEVGPAVRDRVAELERTGGLQALTGELLRLNPRGLGTLDPKNPRRVARALERCLASGRSLAEIEADFRALPPPFPGFEKRVCVLDRDSVELELRIDRRAREMVEGGLIEEVRRLREQGIECNPAAARAIGYRETLAWLDDPRRCSKEDLAARIAADTRGLVRKQRTWFRGQLQGARRAMAGEEATSAEHALFGRED